MKDILENVIRRNVRDIGRGDKQKTHRYCLQRIEEAIGFLAAIGLLSSHLFFLTEHTNYCWT